MSAPNQGRQSPDPEHQSGAQQSTTLGSGEHSATKDSNQKDTLAGLPSNPEHPLQKAAEEKTSKGT
jgi:hypothetical protein